MKKFFILKKQKKLVLLIIVDGFLTSILDKFFKFK